MAEVKENYRAKIKAALITQKRLAKMTKIHEVRISCVLNGTLEFSDEEIDKVYKALKLKRDGKS
jgi:plasmid maintenance system antidote protein VapI